MVMCAHCKTQETRFYVSGIPICVECAVGKPKPSSTASIQAVLTRDLHEATLWVKSATMEFNAVTSNIPSLVPQPDGTQRIHNASRALKMARAELKIAHNRLDDFLSRGIIPDDLKRGG